MSALPIAPTAAPAPAVAAVKTLVVIDLVDSVGLVRRLGDGRASVVLRRHDRLARGLLSEHGGREIDKTDGFLLLFERPIDAVRYVLAYHRGLRRLARESESELLARAGIHLGEVYLHDNAPEDVARGAKPVEVEGLAKATAARIGALATGGQTLLSRGTFDLARRATAGGDDESGNRGERLRWLAHGPYLFQGVDEPLEIFEVGVEGRSPLAAPPDGAKARRAVAAGDELVLGWRPAAGQTVPGRPHWRLVEKQGEGGFGEVWLAEHQHTAEQRIFKFCLQADRLRGLRREVILFRVLRESLGHRSDIARILDWSFDEPPYFLESEYTAGGSLVAWAESEGGIDAVPLDMRLELLAQVAEALDAAHSVGVLHKDVKPANVLIASRADGRPQAVLTDFGIGLLTDREVLAAHGITVADVTGMLADGRRSSSEGTPLYAAPELVEGKPPTVRADLYALGVMIYQVAVGDLTRAVAAGWERGVDDPVLRADLAACLDHNPERRPRSALEIAENLRALDARRAAYREERRRHEAETRSQRRRQIYKAVAAVSSLFLVVVSLLAYQAIDARRQAETRRAQAEALMSYMTGDLRVELFKVGQLRPLEELAGRVLEYLDALPERQRTAQDRSWRAEAFGVISSVRVERGDLAGALETQREAVASSERVVAEAPASVEWRGELAGHRMRLGRLLFRQQDVASATDQFERALGIYQELTKARPDETRWRRFGAQARINLGRLARDGGDLEAAFEHFEQARTEIEQLLAADPENGMIQQDLAGGHSYLASVLERRGDLEGALRGYGEQRRLLEDLIGKEPEVGMWRDQLATVHNHLGRMLDLLGRAPEALEHFRAAIEILERRLEADPDHTGHQRKLAINRVCAGHVEIDLGDPLAGREDFATAHRLLTELVARDPHRTSWRRDLAGAHHGDGRALLALGDAATAAERATLAIKLLDELAEASPVDRQTARWLGEAWLLAGEAAGAIGDGERAETAWQRAIEVLEPHLEGSRDPRLLEPWAQAMLFLGRGQEARPVVRKLAAMGLRHLPATTN